MPKLVARLARRSTIVGLPPSAVPNFAKSLIVVARRGFSDAARRSIVSLSERSFFARAPLGCDVSRGRERDVRDECASVCLGGAGRQCIEAVLPLATDEVRVDVRTPSRSAVFRYGQHVSAVGKSLYKTQPACIQVRETVPGRGGRQEPPADARGERRVPRMGLLSMLRRPSTSSRRRPCAGGRSGSRRPARSKRRTAPTAARR